MRALLLSVGVSLFSTAVAAQSYPGKPIRIIAPYAAGDTSDILAPPPRETVAKPNAELGKVLNTAEMKERFAKQGTEVRTGTPGSLGQWMSTEQAKWAKVVKESGTKFE